MAPDDIRTLELTRDEWALLSRLLELRQRELLGEIRHTGHRAYREKLMNELEMVDRLLVKIPAEKEQTAT